MTKKETKNIEAYKKAFKEIEKKIGAAHKKLKASMLKDAPLKTIQKYTNELMLLLGEANYLAKECKRMTKKK